METLTSGCDVAGVSSPPTPHLCAPPTGRPCCPSCTWMRTTPARSWATGTRGMGSRTRQVRCPRLQHHCRPPRRPPPPPRQRVLVLPRTRLEATPLHTCLANWGRSRAGSQGPPDPDLSPHHSAPVALLRRLPRPHGLHEQAQKQQGTLASARQTSLLTGSGPACAGGGPVGPAAGGGHRGRESCSPAALP